MMKKEGNVINKPGTETLLEIKSTGILILVFPASRTVRNES